MSHHTTLLMAACPRSDPGQVRTGPRSFRPSSAMSDQSAHGSPGLGHHVGQGDLRGGHHGGAGRQISKSVRLSQDLLEYFF